MNRVLIWALIIMRKVPTCTIGFANHLVLVVYFISYNKLVWREKCPLTIHLPYIRGIYLSSSIRKKCILKVDVVHDQVTYFNRTPIFQGMWSGVAPGTDINNPRV